MAKPKQSRRFDGCSFTLVVGLVMTALYVANGILVRALLGTNPPGIDNRIIQPLQFGLPILLIFLEYWIFDRFMRRFSGNREN